MAVFNFIENNFAVSILALGAGIFLALCLTIYCFIKILSIRKKSKVFFEGNNGKNLESLILKNAGEIKLLDSEIQDLYNISNQVHKLALEGVHKVSIIRFNPFGDIGGDQSFSVAFLNGKNTGVVISSLHTKEGTRVYSKPIIKGEAEKYPLTEEEKNVVKIAMQNKSNKI